MAKIQPSGSSVAIYYIETDQLDTPRAVIRPSDNTQMWTWFSDPFGSDAPNTNPQGAGAFTYDLRFPGQIAGAWGSTFENNFRDFDPATGRYVESDPIGLAGGSYSTYAYANGNPILRRDSLGLAGGKEDEEEETPAAANPILQLQYQWLLIKSVSMTQVTRTVDIGHKETQSAIPIFPEFSGNLKHISQEAYVRNLGHRSKDCIPPRQFYPGQTDSVMTSGVNSQPTRFSSRCSPDNRSR